MAHTLQSLPSLKHHGEGKKKSQRAFTVPEMLAVIAIILILLSLLLPSMGKSREAAISAKCQSNQHQIHIAMKAANKMVNEFTRLPNAGAWTGFVRKQGAAEAMICPSLGKGEEPSLGDVYSVQVSGGSTTFTWIEDIKAGQLAADPQLCRVYQGGYMGTFGESGQSWIENAWGGPITDGQMGVGYDDDGGYVVVFGPHPTIYSIDAPGDTSCGSDHWVCVGEAGTQWKGEQVMQLTGNAHKNIVDPPVEIGSATYGMNNQVSDKKHRGSQVLLMDYNRTIVRVGANGVFLDDFNKQFAPRHFNKANVLFVDGHIQLMARGEMAATQPFWYPN
ncbi:MAG: prepilin-type N-terminal cleavage/methylation domain-containing protein [Phycisphaeraceae bacterium]